MEAIATKQRPILFSTPMVQAILEGRKTQTRRIIKFPSDCSEKNAVPALGDYCYPCLRCNLKNDVGYDEIYCPYGEPGDGLWVKELHYRYGKWIENGTTTTGKQKWKFVPDAQFNTARFYDNPPAVIEKGNYLGTGWHKRPSLYMPRTECRLFLEITKVRAERLQDIEYGDARAEGIELGPKFNYRNYLTGEFGLAPDKSFQTLWTKIDGPESWEANPWVWVIEFKRVDKPAKTKQPVHALAPGCNKNL